MRNGCLRTPSPYFENSWSESPRFSPDSKRISSTLTRSHRIKETLLPWGVVAVVLTIEIFTFGSSVGQFLVGEWLPSAIVVIVEYILLIYAVIVALWISYDLLSVSSGKGLMHASFGMILPSPVSHSKASKPHNLLDTSNRADSSWVDEHHFGKIAEESPSQSHLAYASPNRSFNTFNDSSQQMDVSTGSFMDSLGGFSGNVVRSRHSPYSKTIHSIHTREQLDYLLSKDNSIYTDASTSRNSSFQYFNVLDIGAPEDRRGYQVSEQLEPSDSKENIVVKMGPGSRIILSPASSEGDGQDEMTRLRHALQHARHSPRKAGSILRRSESTERRRRSSMSVSSPERPVLASGSGSMSVNAEIDAKRSSLREVDLARGEQRLRAWLVNTILEPLHQRIKETNLKLEKEHASPPIKIGVSSVEALQAAMVNRPELLDTMLPYILPFLQVHSNQSYLVSRISELAADKFMMEYCWNSGGREPVQEKLSSGRVARRPWGEHLPTDAELVFLLFSAYMDSQLTSNPLVGSCRLAQPFSALYTLKAPQRPNAVHLAAESFYIHMSSASPPNFDFVFNDADGSPSRAVIPRGTKNFFYAVLSFINHAKVNNNGRLDRLSIGPTGLNIACVLE
ncbi:Transmembrane protein [Trichostrongylus colubriformis]|uniref:Transmembrane protein n=1 Tax=Trichostrongylus colubriformis TaxID=6319 RepID=A0AAN8G172_TRICO